MEYKSANSHGSLPKILCQVLVEMRCRLAAVIRVLSPPSPTPPPLKARGYFVGGGGTNPDNHQSATHSRTRGHLPESTGVSPEPCSSQTQLSAHCLSAHLHCGSPSSFTGISLSSRRGAAKGPLNVSAGAGKMAQWLSSLRTWEPEFNPQNPQCRKRKLSPARCPLSSIPTRWHSRDE